jgi:hypothetical protein
MYAINNFEGGNFQSADRKTLDGLQRTEMHFEHNIIL